MEKGSYGALKNKTANPDESPKPKLTPTELRKHNLPFVIRRIQEALLESDEEKALQEIDIYLRNLPRTDYSIAIHELGAAVVEEPELTAIVQKYLASRK